SRQDRISALLPNSPIGCYARCSISRRRGCGTAGRLAGDYRYCVWRERVWD
ncbi:MAG: hypothetical protein AVDCRST_MAG26-194, partial [uncultured Chloroflexia bacterium]